MLRHLRALVPLLLLASCRSFDFERQQVFLRYQPEADVLDVVLAYEGVGTNSEKAKEVAETSATLADIGQGKRHFMFWDWPLDLDIEKGIVGAQEDLKNERVEFSAVLSFLEYETNISMVESRFLVDEGGGERLCLVQRVRFGQGSRALRLIDEIINAVQHEELSGEGGKPVQDPASDALLLARARRGGSWARFDGTELEVSIPMTGEQAARQLEELLADRSQVIACLSESLTALHVTGEELRLRFAPARDGWIAFTLADDSRKVRGGMAEELGRHEVKVATGDLAAEVARLKAMP